MSVRLFNTAHLAEELGRGRGYVSAMKAAGFQFTHGLKTQLQPALDWLASNPNFRVKQVYPSKVKLSPPRSKTGQAPRGSLAGKRGA